ncbi:site-specific DNA-methyltransferase [Candidatus Riflebacteria bacterium]
MDLKKLSKSELVSIIKKIQEHGTLPDFFYSPSLLNNNCASIPSEDRCPALMENIDREIKQDSPDPENWLIEGDNMHALMALRKSHREKVDTIFIDPPYNSGNRDYRYQDNFTLKKDKIPHGNWLSFIHPRLVLARELLKDSGVIFICIDDREMAPLKLLCDSIFNPRNFLGPFIWLNRTTPNDAKNNFAVDHEYILVYTKERKKFRFRGTIKDLSRYKNSDSDPNGPWMRDNPSAASGSEKDRFPIENPFTAQVYYPPKGRFWAFSRRRVDEWYKSGKLVFPEENNKNFLLKKYLNELRSNRKPLSSIITGILTMHGTREMKEIFAGENPFKYPKPSILIEYILDKMSGENAVVLDFFAGSGSTGHAVLKLNKKDGGKRRFILCTNNEWLNTGAESEEGGICEKVTYPRLKKVISGYKNARGDLIEACPGKLKYFHTVFEEKPGTSGGDPEPENHKNSAN